MISEIIIAACLKNSRETLQVRLDTYQGQAVIDCRAWYQGGDGTMKPGRGGLTLGVRHLPQLADAIAKALATAIEAGLISSDGSQ
jgi:hypothetical protein